MKHCVIALNDKFSRHYVSIICHEDNEKEILTALKNKYSSKDKAAMLIALGDLLHLNARQLCALSRDRGFSESNVKPVSHQSLDALILYGKSIGAEALYLFDEQWQMLSLHNQARCEVA